MQVRYRHKSLFWSNSWLSKIAGCAKCQKHLPTTMRCTSHSRRHTSECLFLTACSMDEYAEEKRTEKNLIVRSGISEAETTNNKRLRSTFCIEAIQTRSIARPLCDSRALVEFIRAFDHLLLPHNLKGSRVSTLTNNKTNTQHTHKQTLLKTIPPSLSYCCTGGNY